MAARGTGACDGAAARRAARPSVRALLPVAVAAMVAALLPAGDAVGLADPPTYVLLRPHRARGRGHPDRGAA